MPIKICEKCSLKEMDNHIFQLMVMKNSVCARLKQAYVFDVINKDIYRKCQKPQIVHISIIFN